MGMTIPATTAIAPMRESPGSQAYLSLRSTLLHRSKIRKIWENKGYFMGNK